MAKVLAWMPNGLVALAILLVAWLFWRLVRQAMRMTVERTELDPTASNFLLTILKEALIKTA